MARRGITCPLREMEYDVAGAFADDDDDDDDEDEVRGAGRVRAV